MNVEEFFVVWSVNGDLCVEDMFIRGIFSLFRNIFEDKVYYMMIFRDLWNG